MPRVHAASASVVAAVLGERVAEQFPRRRVVRVALERLAQVADRTPAVARLEVLETERVAQQRPVARRAAQLLQALDQGRGHFG